ncbi:hypothetical protein ACH4UV_33615 [Streptomyces sp. NPDC020802]
MSVGSGLRFLDAASAISRPNSSRTLARNRSWNNSAISWQVSGP